MTPTPAAKAKLMPEDAIKFLEICAKWFARRDTGGEDLAHWSNVYNSENCIRTADLIRALTSGAAGEEMPYAKWLKEAADPNCKLCDGSGVFYGNVHICQCVTRGHLTPAPRQPEQARQMGPSGPIPFPKEYFDLTIENLGHAKEAINLVLDDLWKGRNPFSNAKKTLARISDAETCLNKTDIAPTPDLRAAVEALEFYANDMNYLGIITSNRMEWPINCDNGKRAREALTTLKARMPGVGE